ncbi:phospholipid-transporting ATPase ABCA3-like isoform X2 [Dermatophagoides pteronyssinus]
MVDYYVQQNSDSIRCGIWFNSLTEDSLDFKLRFSFAPKGLRDEFDFDQVNEFTWQTSRNFPIFQKPGPRTNYSDKGGPPAYYTNGFLFIQHFICRAYSYLQKPNETSQFFHNVHSYNVLRFPYPPYNNDQFMFSLQFMFPMIMMISFIYPNVNLVKNIVLEKEIRLKEVMKMMNLKDWIYWTSWFFDSLIWNSFSIIIITILFCVPFRPDHGIISHSNPILILIFFMAYIISSISFCFLLSAFFTNANIAGIGAGTIYFLTFVPYMSVSMNYQQLSRVVKIVISLLFNTNMALGCMFISIWESEHVGLQWSNLSEPATLDDSVTFKDILMMFAIDSIIYFTLALYISNVFPGRYGIPRKWYYFLQPSYWFEWKSKNRIRSNDNEMQDKQIIQNKRGIELCGLTKSYNRGKIKALQNFDLSMKPDEITVLLGHNGAGKTTLMSILCGLIPSTSGSIYIGDSNSENDFDEIRKSLGVCPQFDVLFNHLTVQEHLWFYCKLKNIDDSKINDYIDKMIKMLDFVDKRHNQAHTLSGGMKRKLSVGIALIGDSKIVLLDEATSGMDVSARRFIWDLLIKEKKNRVILLSTHFMEEADVLGDKIAIMEQGKLKCFGSPIELKKEHGLGYLLTLVVQEDQFDIRLLADLIRSYIHHAKILTSIGREVTFSLPENEAFKFESLFATIEQNMTKLGIMNFGISMTTLEEVFLRVGDFAQQGTEQMNRFYEEKNQHLNDKLDKELSMIEKIKHNSLKFNQGFPHHLQVYYSLFVKKILFTYRNLFTLFAQFILPGLILGLSITVNRNQMNQNAISPPLLLNIDKFHEIEATIFHDNNQQINSLSNLYQNNIRNAHTITIVDEKVNQTDQLKDYAIEYLANYGAEHEDRFNMYYIISAIFGMTENGMNIIAMYNNQAYHSSAISVSIVDETIIQHIVGENFRLKIWNHPFPRKHFDNIQAVGFDMSEQLQVSNNIQFSVAFLLASFIIFLVKEQSTNFKHIQQISGLHLFQYWTSNFIIDFIIYLISSSMSCAIIYWLNVTSYNEWKQLGRLFVIYAIHGFASLPFVYICSLFFRNSATAYVRLALYTLILGTITFLVVLILEIPALDVLKLSKMLDYVFSFIVPIHNMGMATYDLSSNAMALDTCLSDVIIFNQTWNIQQLCHYDIESLGMIKMCCKEICGMRCWGFEENFFSITKPGIGSNLLAMTIQGIVFWIILVILESRLIHRIKIKSSPTIDNKKQSSDMDTEESDVEAENDRLKRRSLFSLNRTDSMIVKNASKNYGKFQAVRDISFGVKRGECFGVLGENGAGKTTMFKMITGSEDMTSGDILVNGNSVKKDIRLIYRDIGYCPQFNGLIDHLTGRETLKIISRIRGINENIIDEQIDALSRLLFFQKHIDQQISGYSGGTKRKLSFAISIVGNPLIAFLDEPTTGVDPVSRRCLWNAIHMVRKAGSSLVLTSHSMEECEALCNRLIIMVHGRITCLGSPMHLKQKYGAGYIVHIKLRNPIVEKSIRELDKFMRTKFIECYVDGIHNNMVVYKIQTNQIKLSQLFGSIERSKDLLSIEDYSICQTSLERIFLSFVRKSKK